MRLNFDHPACRLCQYNWLAVERMGLRSQCPKSVSPDLLVQAFLPHPSAGRAAPRAIWRKDGNHLRRAPWGWEWHSDDCARHASAGVVRSGKLRISTGTVGSAVAQIPSPRSSRLWINYQSVRRICSSRDFSFMPRGSACADADRAACRRTCLSADRVNASQPTEEF
jgi:hypothetical protein